MVAPKGHGVTKCINQSQSCASCKKNKERRPLKCCSVCKNTLYCSKECQKAHWPTHKRDCGPRACSGVKKQVIQSRGKSEKKNVFAAGNTNTVRELVGKKCLIRCFLHRQKTQALWDTGSQVCTIDEVWKHNHLPGVPLRDITELTDPHDPLQLEAANGTEMPYVGWLEVLFQLTGSDNEWLIPVLVLKGKQQQCPIIGFNVIEHIVLHSQGDQVEHRDKEELVKAVKVAFPHLRKNKAKIFINAVSLEQTREYKVRTVNERISVPKRSSIQIEC